MQQPPSDPGRRPGLNPTWRRIAASYALVLAFFVLLWAISQPLAGLGALAVLAGLFVGAKRAARLRRCFYTCDALTLRPFGNVRITISQVEN
ncbi:flagellar motor protein MotB [Haloarcula sp. 1CSR25-25]|uniref:flagellar motor protein MotB n=1 Tax=Haloarcula sp. 1CSR25-25 TaxID=2862545 RepID=UPI0028957771|nr:flagellar motor protein MotB [Haloarcula sp. 1CSR25-25]MDT3433480.1 flagellar motor protein MotB [Haloarcula sp. 1CSR25-25]